MTYDSPCFATLEKPLIFNLIYLELTITAVSAPRTVCLNPQETSQDAEESPVFLLA